MHCKSFTFRCKIYGRRVFKWITQRILLTFALVKLLVFAPLFNAQIKHVLNYFALEMAAIVARRRHCRVQRARGRRERIFSTCINLFRRQEEHIVQTYRLPSHAIFNLLQEKKTTRSHAIPSLSKLLANLNFLVSGCFQHTVASSFLYSLFATTLICAALGILRWSICKWDVASVFFNLHVVSKSPAEISTPIGALLELCSRANLPFSKTGPKSKLTTKQTCLIHNQAPNSTQLTEVNIAVICFHMIELNVFYSWMFK